MPEIMANGIRIHYEETGMGDPLILIMGLGADGSLWEQHVKVYRENFCCIMIDNRGAGRSEKPNGPYTIIQMATDTIGLMDALGIQKAHISGVSMGGAIAQELAINWPDRVKSITIISSWSKCDAYTNRILDTFKNLVETSDHIAFNRLLQLWIFTPEYHIKCMDDLLLREESGEKYPYPMPTWAFKAQCEACMLHDTTNRLNKIKAPTLITVGECDIFTPVHYSKTLAENILGSQLYVVKGGGHTHHWEKLKEFNSKTLSFLIEN